MTDKAQMLAYLERGPEIDASAPRIVCAAVKNKDGRLLIGPRHFDRVMLRTLMDLPDWDTAEWRGGEQGFIDQHGRFLTREEAWVIAKAMGQVIRDTGMPDNGVLYSEHLY